MNHKTVILISGKQGSGKSTLTSLLLEALDGWTCELKFASVIYDIHDAARAVLQDLGIDPPPGLEIKDGKLLQFLGTEWGRQTYGEDIWVKCAQAEVAKYFKRQEDTGLAEEGSAVIVSDCRFKNEFEAFPEALRIRLECPRELRQQRCEQWRDNDKHPSEIDLDTYVAENRFDLVFDTHLDRPEKIVEKILSHLKEKS